jgi:hypothetical protein
MSSQNATEDIPMRRLSPSLSRVHRRRFIISESFQESQEGTEVESQSTQDEAKEAKEEEQLLNIIAVNWTDFWKRVKIYPEQPVEYSDASGYVSSRQRSRNPVQARVRARSNAYVSDTESESDTESNTLVITCQGCKDGQANQMAHMDYGGCLCNDVVV